MAARWYDDFPPYVPVGERKRRNRELGKMLSSRGERLCPVAVQGRGRKMAFSFWGDRWCRHLESFSDYENRLPRGRSYLRHGAVLDLQIEKGQVTALVSGSDLYHVEIDIEPLKPRRWTAIRKTCSGRIGSLLELLEGQLSDEVMSVVTDPKKGLLPLSGEISFECDCPDWAAMCKHIAAVLFGIGVRLDDEPELLFKLRGVDPDELIAGDLALPGAASEEDASLADADLSDIFGIELEAETDEESGSAPAARKTRTKRPPGSQAKRKRETHPKTARRARRFNPTGDAILALREDFGLSVPEFADVMGVSIPTVYRWEISSEKLKPRAALLRRLEHLADIRADYLAQRR